MPMEPLNVDAPHVRELNTLVDQLRRRHQKFVPYIHQQHGGVRARVLSVLRDPGKATLRTQVLCTENPDPTSRRQRDLMAQTGLAMTDLCPWNAYPFAHDKEVDGDLTPDLIARGAVVLTDVLPLMTHMQVLLLQGAEARWAWAMVQAFRPRYASPPFEVVETCHPLGTRGRTALDTESKKEEQRTAWQRAAHAVRRR